jgi:hypothetical protein
VSNAACASRTDLGAPPEAPPTPAVTTVDLRDVHRNAAYIVRKAHQPTIASYRTMLKAGQTPPPLTIGRIDGVLTLLCGWHRLEAAAGHEISYAYPVVIVDCTAAEAHWIAAKDNLRHGLPLTRKDKREVFRRFIRAGMHRRASGRYLTYDEIVDALGGIAVKGSVHGWMKKMYPSIARAMGGYDELKGTRGPRDSAPPTPGQSVCEHLAQALTCVRGVSDPGQRYECHAAAQRLVHALAKAGPMLPPDF